MFVVVGLGVRDDLFRVEVIELRELLFFRVFKVFCKLFFGCNCVWSLIGKGRFDLIILWSGANNLKVGLYWKYL